MKRIVVLLYILITLCITLMANEHTTAKSALLKENGKVFLIQDGKKCEIDTKSVIVKLKTKKGELRQYLKSTFNNKKGLFIVSVPDSIEVDKFVSYLNNLGDFEYVEYNTYCTPCLIPNDSFVGNQWYLNEINANLAWELTTGLPTIKVGVIDCGIQLDHEDLAYGNDSYSNLSTIEYYDYISSTDHTPPTDHGTMIAGIVGAKTNNNIGISGISGGNNSSGIKLISFRSEYIVSNVIQAIYGAINSGVKIINLSMSSNWSYGFEEAIDDAYDNNITVVCSTGNDNLTNIPFPASHPKTIAVGASNNNHDRAYFSNRGTGIDLIAPGTNIMSTSLNSDYNNYGGTSFSAPMVCGVAALMLSVNQSLTPDQIREKIRASATKMPNYHQNGILWSSEVGCGILNAFAAICHVLYNISGPEIVCNTGTYSVAGIPNGVTAVWSVPSGLSITSGQGTNTITVQRQSSISSCGSVTVQFFVGGESKCTLRKDNVVVGTPDLGMCINLEASNGDNGYWTSNYTAAYNTFTVDEDLSWAYDRVEGQLYKMDNNFNPSQLVASWNNISTHGASIPGYAEGWYLFKIRGVNDCGNSEWLVQEVEMVDLSGLNFIINYDSSSDMLSVLLKEPQTKKNSIGTTTDPLKISGTYDIQIWNSMKPEMVRNYKTNLKTYQISLSGLQKGIYIVRVVKDGKTYSRKFAKR